MSLAPVVVLLQGIATAACNRDFSLKSRWYTKSSLVRATKRSATVTDEKSHCP